MSKQNPTVELNTFNADAALDEQRVVFTPVQKPEGQLMGQPQSRFTKFEGWITNMFRDTQGRFYVRAVKGMQVEWYHITIREKLWMAIARCGQCGVEIGRAEDVPEHKRTMVGLSAAFMLCENPDHNTASDINFRAKVEWHPQDTDACPVGGVS